MKFCKKCGKELTPEQHKNIFCSTECHLLFQKEEKINKWLNGEIDGGIKGNQISQTIRNYLLEINNYACELCGWNKLNPVTGKCPLEIHHKDGNCLNNSKENLQVLCPNCHSVTDNYKALNKDSNRENRTVNRKNYCIDCGIEISQEALRCKSCNSKTQITIKPVTKEELKEKIRYIPFTTIGAEYNVSDNTIRKWCLSYGLPTRKKDINAYSDEEWKTI